MATGRASAFFALAAATVCVIVLVTCRSLFVAPQLDPDDFRYLHSVLELEQGTGSLRRAAIVENQWRHLWWIDVQGTVRFFRPTTVLSYWWDARLWRDHVPTGLMVTNVALHVLCSVLVAIMVLRWLGAGLPAFLASALFAAFFCHGEVLWYGAGRTDSLSAVGFLAALVFHTGRRERRWLGLPCYVFAFISKELAASLPLLLLAHDLLVERRAAGVRALIRCEWRLYSMYAVAALGVVALRQAALGADSGSWVHPYFVSPNRADFPAHVWAQLRTYFENLFLARPTKPFMEPAELGAYTTRGGLLVTVVALALAALMLRRERRFAFCLLMAFAVSIPTAVVYVSERYLYLPSFAVATIMALILAALRKHRVVYVVACAIAVVWIAHQAYWLQRKNEFFSVQVQREPTFLAQQLQRIEPLIAAQQRFLLINLPGSWLGAQFVEQQLRVARHDLGVWARALTVMPADGAMGEDVHVERDGDFAVVVRSVAPDGRAAAPVLDGSRQTFPWVVLEKGTRVAGADLGFQVEVLDGTAVRANSLRFTLPEPLDHYTLLQWHAHPDRRLPEGDRRRLASVDVVRPR